MRSLIGSQDFTNHYIMFGLLLGFALVHSGLAALRPWAESKVGPRVYRIFFALCSLPSASILIFYFLNHRYDGLIFWQLQDVAIVKPLVWILSAISFIFLYPATFNLLEIAAIQKPQVHLFETGIIRISRHPQMVGQILWCIAHTLWIGSTFTLLTSTGLILHHIFAVWHGDHRLEKRYGDSFIALKSRTSVIPFLAILDGRQKLVPREFIRPAYLVVMLFILVLWSAHPWLMQISTGM